MDTRQLRYFIAVSETLSFRRAAERLHIAQPPLSQSIRRLEIQLGVTLFQRDRRGTQLTPAGKAALEQARRALFHVEQFDRSAKAAASGEAGSLRIGFVGSATCSVMPELMPQYVQRYPQVELHLIESTTRRVIPQVEQGELDVGLIRYPLAAPTKLELMPIQPDRFVAALPSNTSLARKRRLHLQDLASQPFIFYSSSEVPGLHAAALSACQRAGFFPRVYQQTIQVQTMISLVESGLGVAIVPSVAARYAAPGVSFKTLQGLAEDTAIGIALAWKPDDAIPVVQRFAEAAAQLQPHAVKQVAKARD